MEVLFYCTVSEVSDKKIYCDLFFEELWFSRHPEKSPLGEGTDFCIGIWPWPPQKKSAQILTSWKNVKNSRIHMAVVCGREAFLLIVGAEGTDEPPCPFPAPWGLSPTPPMAQDPFQPPRDVSPFCWSPAPHIHQVESTREANSHPTLASPQPQGGAQCPGLELSPVPPGHPTPGWGRDRPCLPRAEGCPWPPCARHW